MDDVGRLQRWSFTMAKKGDRSMPTHRMAMSPPRMQMPGWRECSEGHLRCDSSVGILVQDLLKVGNKGKRALLDGEVKCFKGPTDCNSCLYGTYSKGKLEILEARRRG